MREDIRALQTVDDYSFNEKGRKVTIPKGEKFLEVSRPNAGWICVSSIKDSVNYILPSKILAEVDTVHENSCVGLAHMTSEKIKLSEFDLTDSPEIASQNPMDSPLRATGEMSTRICDELPPANDMQSPSYQGYDSVSLLRHRLTKPAITKQSTLPRTPVKYGSTKFGPQHCATLPRSHSTAAYHTSSHEPAVGLKRSSHSFSSEDTVGSDVVESPADDSTGQFPPISCPYPQPDDSSPPDKDPIPATISPVSAHSGDVDKFPLPAATSPISPSEIASPASASFPLPPTLSELEDDQHDDTERSTRVSLPPHWKQVTVDGEEQYVHSNTGEQWAVARDDQGQSYYYELQSRRTVWSLSELDNEADAEAHAANENPVVATPSPVAHSAYPLGSTETLLSEIQPVAKSTIKKSNDTLSDPDKSETLYHLMEIRNIIISSPIDAKLVNFERRGLVQWSKLYEKGNRMRERWSEALLVLSGPYLLFYKDLKAATAKTGHPLGKYFIKFHVLRLLLTNASESETTRPNVLKVELENSPGGTTAVLVSFLPKELECWRAAILCGKRLLHEGRLSSPSSRRAPRAISRIDGNLLTKLREFFQRRPSAESLRSRGILKNEPVFASSLMQICEAESTTVPRFVVNAIRAIESRGLDQRGLYRIAGNAAQVQKLRCAVDQGNYSLDSNKWSQEVLTDSLKLFFRELKEPLFVHELFPKISALLDHDLPDSDLVVHFRDLIQSMPPQHIATANVLFNHLKKVIQHSDSNKMTADNLATLFGPGLVRSEPGVYSWGALSVQVPFVNFCLHHVDQLFPASDQMAITR